MTHVTLYAADKGDDPADPAVRANANPGLGTIKPRCFMADAYEMASQSGIRLEFRAWQLNVPLQPGRELLLHYDTLRKDCAVDPQTIPGEPVHIGIDLGGSASMTGATVACELSGVVRVLGAFPGADLQRLAARPRRSPPPI